MYDPHGRHGIKKSCVHQFGSLELYIQLFDFLSLLHEINLFTDSEVHVAVC